MVFGWRERGGTLPRSHRIYRSECQTGSLYLIVGYIGSLLPYNSASMVEIHGTNILDAPQLKQLKTPYPQYKCFLDADLTLIDLFTSIFLPVSTNLKRFTLQISWGEGVVARYGLVKGASYSHGFICQETKAIRNLVLQLLKDRRGILLATFHHLFRGIQYVKYNQYLLYIPGGCQMVRFLKGVNSPFVEVSLAALGGCFTWIFIEYSIFAHVCIL